MPIVKIDMLEGRTDEQKKELARQVTEAVVKTVDAKPESVTVIINEHPGLHIAKAGKPLG